MTESERRNTALVAVGTAALISYLVLLFGNPLLELFGIGINHFKVAGGVVLFILGVEMTLGYPLTNPEGTKEGSAAAIASIIATPLLTGPAAMTAIIVSSKEYGILTSFIAISVVLLLTLILFFLGIRIRRMMGTVPLQVLSTLLGLITIAWGVKFILDGLGAG
jgi:multiple antibiotic resistance protein